MHEDASLTKARLLYSTTPTPVHRKRHAPEARIPIHSEFSGPFGTVGTFQSEPGDGVKVNITQQLQKETASSLVLGGPVGKSAADCHLNTRKVSRRLEQVADVKAGISSSRLLPSGSPLSVTSSETLAEDRDKESDPLFDYGLQTQARQKSPVQQQQEPDESFVPDPFVTFRVIAEEFQINSKITDPHGDIRRLELVTEIHQRWMKTLGNQFREELRISPQQSTTPDIINLTYEGFAVKERFEQCRFCLLADLGGSADDNVIPLNSETGYCCDECKDCQTFRDEYEWLVEASQAYNERYAGSAKASTRNP